MVPKEENAGHQHFLIHHNVCKSLLFHDCYNLELCGKESTIYQTIKTVTDIDNQSAENTDVAFVKGANERNEFFDKVNKQ